MRTVSLVTTACLIVTLGLATPGHASEANRRAAQVHYDQGVRAYNLDRFDDAIAAFEKAYELDPAPILLFNIAQAHRQAGNHQKSLVFYRRYLDQSPANAKNRADVEKRIKDLEEILAKQGEVKNKPPTQVAATGDEETTAPQAASSTAPAAATTAETPTVAGRLEERPGRTLRIAGLSTASAGVVALAAGAIFGMQARSASDDVQSAPQFDPDRDNSGRRAETLQWVFYGVGTAALAAGGALYYLGHRRAEPPASTVAVVPTPRGTGAVATYQLRF